MLLSLFSSLGSSSAEGTSASLSLPLIETFGELETEESFLEALTNSGGTPGSKKSEKKEKKIVKYNNNIFRISGEKNLR